MGRRPLRALVIGALIVAGGTSVRPSLAATLPPDLHFQTLAARRADVHFHQGLEGEARRVASLVDEILPTLEARYRCRAPRLEVVLSDETDEPNGLVGLLPYPLLRLTAARGYGGDGFGVYEDWWRFVLTHELAHVIHLGQARGLVRLGRRVFGRAPFLFPNLAAQSWMVEGLATLEETRGTAFGRGRDPDARMFVRMAALEGRLPGEDRATNGLEPWPDGYASYLFGEAFLRDLSGRYGEDVVPRLARSQAALPAPYVDDLTSMLVTGRTFVHHFSEWRRRARRAAEREARALTAAGLTATHTLTSRGERQTAPRLSPDGALIAYTSTSLTRRRTLRLMRADGSEERILCERNGGTGLSWTPDGRALVFDEPDFHRTYRWWSELSLVDVATGRVRRLTRGQRASDPDVTPDGRAVVFVRRTAVGSELAAITLDGQPLGDLTRSAPGTMWSSPRVAPGRGELIVAARLMPGGFVDLVLLDLARGSLVELTHDRAKDVEPTWSADGTTILFRSDRDGISNIYALRLDGGDGGQPRRVTRVLGGAFAPSLAGTTRQLVFAGYSSRGFDLQLAEVDLAALIPAEPFADRHPEARVLPSPADVPALPYRPWLSLGPRYWMPYLEQPSGATRLGLTTSGGDALGRHAYNLTVHRTDATNTLGYDGGYSYDRFRTTLSLGARDVARPLEEGSRREREVSLRASLPVERSARVTQSLSLAWRAQRRDDTLEAGGDDPATRRTLRLSGIAATWSRSSSRKYDYTPAPVEGGELRLSAAREAPWLGSDLRLVKLAGEARRYGRLGERHALALIAGGATTIGEPEWHDVFTLGGFPSGGLFDASATRLGLVRGFSDDSRIGRHVAYASLECHVALLDPQRGLWSLPAFLRHARGALFVDAGHAWSGRPALADAAVAVGAALSLDLFVGHEVAWTATAGVARGCGPGGTTRAYIQLGR